MSQTMTLCGMKIKNRRLNLASFDHLISDALGVVGLFWTDIGGSSQYGNDAA